MSPRFLIATQDKDRFAPLADALEALINAEICWAASGKEALEQVRADTPILAVVDENLSNMTGLELTRELLMANALINTALVSRLSAEDFHETSEGLGVLLQLPESPGEEEARDMIAALRGIFALPQA